MGEGSLYDSTYWGTKAKTRDELEKTHRVVGVMEHLGYEIAWTVSRFRSHDDYLDVVRQARGSVEE